MYAVEELIWSGDTPLSQQDQISPAPPKGQPAPPPAAAAPAPPSPSSQPSSQPSSWRRLAIPLFAVLAAFGFIALATVRWDAWVGSFVIQTTDDAYVRAETTQLSSRVSGAVLVVTVKDFQRVKAGDLLIQIDPADYVAVVDQAEASVIAAQATFDNVANQIELQYATIAQAEAQQVSANAQ
jgi:membrane fusion protein (multidrug efflux system)